VSEIKNKPTTRFAQRKSQQNTKSLMGGRRARFDFSEPKKIQLAKLKRKAVIWAQRGREANEELGRIFLQIKAIVGHGKWLSYYAENIEPCCKIPDRTAQAYMELARTADSRKSADSADFPQAMDADAVAKRKATARAEAEVGDHSGQKSKSEPKQSNFTLVVPMTADLQEAVSELRDSKAWSIARKKVIALLKQLCIELGFFNKEKK
jgi:hypothetical protein